jgi:hypothetical protein
MTLSMGKRLLSVRVSEKISFHELYVDIVVEFLLQTHVKSANDTHPFLIRFAPVGLAVMLFNSKVTLIILIHHPGADVSCLGLTVLSRSSFDHVHTINLPMLTSPAP